MKRGVLVWWLWLPWALVLAGCRGIPTPPDAAVTPAGETPTEVPTLQTPAALLTPTDAVDAAPTPLPATPTPPPTPTPLPTSTPTPDVGRITGQVWEDRCDVAGATQAENPPANCQLYAGVGYAGDGVRQQDEPGLAGVVVQLAQGPCPGTPLSQTITDARGVYAFENVPPGTYCVSIDAEAPQHAALLNPGVWTQPLPDVGSMTVQVEGGQTQVVNFARTRQRPPTPTPSPTPVPSPQGPTPTPTFTPTPERPKNPYELGDPDILDTLDIPGKNWYLQWQPKVRFLGEPGRLVMRIIGPEPRINYWTFSTFPPIADGYIEATFITGKPCRGKDRYGLIVRSPTRYEGILFLIACDGMYKIIRWNGGLKILQEWTRTPAIHVGPNQVNRVGVWMDGKTLRLYINRALVAEVTEDLFLEGSVGVVIGSDYNRFTAYLDTFAIWRFP